MRIESCSVEDAEVVYRCRSDPESARWSFSSPPASLKEHIEWFKKVMQSGRYFYYKAVSSKDEFIGFVRFEIMDKGVDVSVCLLPAFRGFGISGYMVSKAIQKFHKEHGTHHRLYAHIMIGNIRSFRTFARVRRPPV